MVKHFFLLLLFLTVPYCAVMADGYSYLTFTKSDGSASSINVSNLKITVSDGSLVAKNGSESLTFTLADLAKMAFADVPAAISTASVDADSEGVEVFTVAGIYMGRFANVSDARQKLNAGVYVVKSKSLTRKLSVR